MEIVNLTTFTEVDPNNVWSQTISRNTATGLETYNNSYVYKDYGAGYFEDYEIWFDVRMDTSSDTSSLMGVFKLNNQASAGLSGQLVYLSDIGSGNIWIVARSNNQTSTYIGTIDTVYYLKIYRIVDRMYVKIYSSEEDRINDTDCLDTLDPGISGADDTAWRYLHCGFGITAGAGSKFATGYSENFIIQPALIQSSEETLSLSDTIQFRFIVEIEEQLGLSDKIIVNRREEYLDEILNLNDELETNISLEKSQPDITLSLTDEVIAGYVEMKDLDNDFRSVIQEIEDIDNKINIASQVIDDVDNKFNTVKTELIDIIQKLNTAKLELNDMNMAFHMAYDNLSDVDNKFNMRAQSINDVTNDFRMRLPWQVAGDLGIQSLGKKYLKIYFDNVEITDINIDTIKILKTTGSAHTITFDLERAYDANRPNLEATVLIKYKDIVIYKGYITFIAPTDTPEKIQINCKDKYWLDNRNKVWFDIGHSASDNSELYYRTMSEGLASVGVNFGIGNFIPQSTSLFGTGRSNAISAMVQNCGNFDWYYDEEENKKLWTANGGSIINLEPQKLGENLELYQVLSHDITESAENVVNKLRVQMGDQIIRHPGSQGEVREYTSRIIGVSRVRAIPMWDSGQEIFSRRGQYEGKGFDYHPTSSAYADVFKKYRIVNPTLESWTDYLPPEVEITRPFGAGVSIPSVKGGDGVLSEGFSIDFKEGILTLNDPLYYYTKDADGHMDKLYAPCVTVLIYRQTWITRTETDADNPEIDISNDLMFFTDKVGDYPTTILDTLNLTGLSIQGGIVSRKLSSTGDFIYVSTPTWNDTNFAKDMAYWKLSETADKKVSGTIKITLDACIFYGIELNKRIMVDGILDSPLNITSLTYNMNDFTVDIDVENFRYFKRTVSIPSHGEGMTTTSIRKA